MNVSSSSLGHRRKIRVASFLMAIVIFIVCIIISLYRSTFSETAVEKAFKQTSYSDEVYKNAYQQVESLTIKNNLPNSVFEELVTQEQMDVFVSEYKKYIKDNGVEGLMMEELQTQLKSNLISFAQTKNIEVTEEVEQNMDDYVSQVISICKSSVSNSFLEDFLGYSSLFTKIALIAVPLSLVLIAYCTWIIYKNSSKRHKFRLLRYYATAAGASGLVLVIVPIVLNLLDLDKKLIGIDVQYKYNVASSFLNLSFQSMILSGIALFIIQILLVATWIVLVNRRKS